MHYDWRARRVSPSRRQLDDAALLEQIIKIRAAHEFAATYGSPRVWLELRRQGVRVGRKRVERIMRAHGLQGAHLRRGWRTGSTRQNPSHTAAPDLVDRDFRATAPNRLWVADLIRLVTGQGALWLASVRRDMRGRFANRIVGWATDPRATTTLVLTALNHALRSRDLRAGQLIHHSDKGAQGGFNWSSQHLVQEVGWGVSQGGWSRRRAVRRCGRRGGRRSAVIWSGRSGGESPRG
jgi:putative transposase